MEEKKFFGLLGQLNEFSRKNKGTAIINRAGRIPCLEPEESDILLDSIGTIEDNFHFSEREEYINLAKDFLADQMTADDFSNAFIGTYKGITREVGQMAYDESLELVNFLNIYYIIFFELLEFDVAKRENL